MFQELVDFLGIDAGRMTFSWVSASEGAKWRDVVNEAVTGCVNWTVHGIQELIDLPSISGESMRSPACSRKRCPAHEPPTALLQAALHPGAGSRCGSAVGVTGSADR